MLRAAHGAERGMHMKTDKTRILVECALMIAISTALGYVPIFTMPLGGSITLCSMAPLIVVSLRHGAKWGLLTGSVHGLLQMMLGLKNIFYCTTFAAMVGCALLDYILAFAVMGLACVFAAGIPNRSAGVAVGAFSVGLLRLLCSFLSGILIWGGYAPEGTPVWIYSLQYNASFLMPEIIMTAIAAVAVMKVADKKFPVAI